MPDNKPVVAWAVVDRNNKLAWGDERYEAGAFHDEEWYAVLDAEKKNTEEPPDPWKHMSNNSRVALGYGLPELRPHRAVPVYLDLKYSP